MNHTNGLKIGQVGAVPAATVKGLLDMYTADDKKSLSGATRMSLAALERKSQSGKLRPVIVMSEPGNSQVIVLLTMATFGGDDVEQLPKAFRDVLVPVHPTPALGNGFLPVKMTPSWEEVADPGSSKLSKQQYIVAQKVKYTKGALVTQPWPPESDHPTSVISVAEEHIEILFEYVEEALDRWAQNENKTADIKQLTIHYDLLSIKSQESRSMRSIASRRSFSVAFSSMNKNSALAFDSLSQTSRPCGAKAPRLNSVVECAEPTSGGLAKAYRSRHPSRQRSIFADSSNFGKPNPRCEANWRSATDTKKAPSVRSNATRKTSNAAKI